MGRGGVILPTPNYGNRTAQAFRTQMIEQFGTPTVNAAEQSVLLELFIMTGIVKAQELTDLIFQKCKQIDYERRRDARLEEDKG